MTCRALRFRAASRCHRHDERVIFARPRRANRWRFALILIGAPFTLHEQIAWAQQSTPSAPAPAPSSSASAPDASPPKPPPDNAEGKASSPAPKPAVGGIEGVVRMKE